MDTTEFDDGDFWQLSVSKRSAEEMSAVVGLAMVAATYGLLSCWNLVQMGHSDVTSRMEVVKRLHLCVSKITSKLRLIRPWNAFLGFRRRHRRQWMVLMEAVEVSLQAITLRNLLLRGHQLPLIFVYVVLVVINCATTFYFISIDWTHDMSDEMTVDAILDMCFAVFFPATQLAYAIKTFRGDFEMLRIRQHYFPAKPFERRGRIYGDPEQMSIFSTAIEGLRLRTTADVINVLLFNFLTCLRWASIIEIRRKKSRKIAGSGDSKFISPKSSVGRTPSKMSKAINTQVPGIPSNVGIIFLFTGIVLSVLTAKAVNTSTMLCGPYASSCPVYAYRWFMEDSKAACPCLVFISQSINPTDEERAGPPTEITTNLSILAEAGTLRTIQIINRDLNPTLPPAVQNCVHLQQLILINARILNLPDWTAASFANLEYLQIEGSGEFIDLRYIPEDFFSRMSSLRTLILSDHPLLNRLPSFAGSPGLETIYLGYLNGINSLPSLHAQKNLRTLALNQILRLYVLPSLEEHHDTLTSVYIQLSSVCCNGYFTNGGYDKEVVPCIHSCAFYAGICYNDTSALETAIEDDTIQLVEPWSLPTKETLAFLKPFREDLSICDPRAKVRYSRPRSLNACEGVMYRYCGDNTSDSICYNAGPGRPTCQFDPLVIEMRRAMIRRGLACDAVEEKWLGCAKP